ncbi:hypothetical protein BJ993_000062 [Nocardioides aromaticivorans]|uniref:Knr4/Smi1-like domain-containing protein n=1 Tax=Nocardioides aromaticivorans TaxID=200618 RepID=A0A7Y9ZCN4_9ACTN|nr:SMI1/KNR4 family protein [Nocardioides aromaticivorans]NYI42982.1 hypothetical protein [Nocardioides aromaticivorans]
MSSSLAARLEVLADAYALRGYDVRPNLLPGATSGELDEVEAALGVVLPASYRELYGWSAGVIDEFGTAPRMRFRDESLLPLARVVEERDRLLEVYDWCESVDGRVVAPFASFEGSVLVVACGPQRLTSAVPHPVISYFQGIDVYYDSIEAMVETCIAWASQEGWGPYEAAPNEMEVWRRFNGSVEF